MRNPLALCILLLAVFSASHLQAEEAVPHWIWSSGEEKVVYIRKEFQVPEDAGRIIFAGAADDSYQLFVNGTRITRGDGWNKLQVELLNDSLNLGEKNAIAIRAENSGGSAGFIGRITMEKKEGDPTVMVTDASWTVGTKAEKGWNQHVFEPKATKAAWGAATVLNAAGTEPRAEITAASLANIDLRIPQATPIDSIRVPEGFEVELLYSVPKSDQGSWVAMTVDDKGRLIVSDQYGSFYRMMPPAAGEVLRTADVEKIEVDIGGAQGLLWAHDSLYAVLNTSDWGGRGLYRITDSDGDDKLDKKELLRKFEENGGEHGPHAVLLGPDGESLYVVTGNQTALPEYDKTLVPPVWAEDQILPRVYGRGFMKGVEAPRGWIAKTDKDGKEWTIISTGFRNQYDAAFNRAGELFTYDADMEWDMNLPWYRPTRINHVISGAEFGWRNGSAKFPEYYTDSFGAVVDIGPGSPTGVTFGYGAKFPAKYQNAFFAADWSYGKLYAVHMSPDGASYGGEFEEFMAAQPLPLTDLLIHPEDGAMYVAIGGRRVQSGLYRITYTGDESTEPAEMIPGGEEARELRHQLEAFHGVKSPDAVATSWPHLASEDRAIRYAARTAIEHQPAGQWFEKALTEEDPQAQLAALIAASRVAGDQPDALNKILTSLATLDYDALNHQQRLDLLRAYTLTVVRLGGGYPNTLTDAQEKIIIDHLDPHFPAATREENTEITALFGNLSAPSLPAKGVELLNSEPSQGTQISYARNIRLAEEGWTPELREQYFEWFVRAQTYKGGNSFGNFIADIKKGAVESLNEEQLAALKPIIEKKVESDVPQFTMEALQFVKNYAVDDFNDVIHVGLEGNRDFENGRNLFGATGCYACHRFNQEGGAIGPDLTSVAGKFSPTDLLESIIEPNKEISDQYGAMIFVMNNGSQIMGRIMNLSGDQVRVNTNMYDPNAIVSVDRKLLKEMKPSPISMMPAGLMNMLEKEDVLDLMAYLLSKGDPEDPMFQ